MATRVDTGALCSLSQVKEYLDIKGSDPNKDRLLIDFINRASVNIESYCNMVFKSTEYSEFYSGSKNERIYLDHVPIITVKRVSVGRSNVIRITNTSTITTAFVRVTTTGIILTKDSVEDSTIVFATYTTLATVIAAINLIGNWSAVLLSSAYGNYQSSELLEFHNQSCINSADVYLDICDIVLNDYSVNKEEGYISRSGGFGTGVNNVYVVYTAGNNSVPKDIVGACVETVAFMSKQSDPQGILGLTSKPVGDMGAVSFIDKLPGGFLSQVKAVLDRYRVWNA